MNYKKIFQLKDLAHVGLIGVGAFGRSFLVQSRLMPGIRVSVVCDQNIAVAEEACLQSGMPPENLNICRSGSAAINAIASGKTAIVCNALLLMDLPIDVVVEATGMPEIGAIHARSAIENGKHVVMVTKESDCLVGPVLNRLAEKAGVVYTPADGDQPSLLIGLISWAETLGLEIVCAGKAGELDFVYNPASKTIARGSQVFHFTEKVLGKGAASTTTQRLQVRHQSLETLPRFKVADLCEMAIVINATGYDYDAPQLNAPIARIIEMPDILCNRAEGGILEKEGVIDMVNCLRRSDEISFAGGVFVIVKCRGRETWQFLKKKGHLVNRAGTHAMIFRPHHLLGIETATSVLSACHLNSSTGGIDPKPRVDVGVRASRTLQQGYRLTLQSDHAIVGVTPELLPTNKMASNSPVPYYMAAGNRLKHTVEAGRLLTYGMIDHDPISCLWQLRCEQETYFNGLDPYQ